jgi:transposase InsO family protein
MVNDLHQGRLRRLTTFQPQALWLRAGQPQFIGRVERFEQDLRHLFQLIGPQAQGLTAAPMPHTNRSPSRLSASDLSKRELRRIRSYYRHDFRMTGYGKKPPQS